MSSNDGDGSKRLPFERKIELEKLISLADPIVGADEKAALCDVIDSNWLTMGERVAEFERAFAELHGADAAVAVNSCTAGLHLCLRAFGLGPGDEVLVPSMTFAATSNCVIYTGATPVFVDIVDDKTPHISMDDASGKITPKTRAVIVMHYGGYLADIDSWRAFADRHRLVLIEDAAHAPGLDGAGRLGDASAFSFFTNKNMTTAEGGMVVTRDPKTLEKIRLMRSHGMTTNTLDRYRGHSFNYDIVDLGYNYRLDELRAALGCVQLKRLKAWNEDRKRLVGFYRKKIRRQLPQLAVPFEENHPTAAHLMPVLLPPETNRRKIMERLRKKGIQSSIHYPPIHRFSYYQEHFSDISLPMTEAFAERELTLPLHPLLEEKDIERVVGNLGDTLEKVENTRKGENCCR